MIEAGQRSDAGGQGHPGAEPFALGPPTAPRVLLFHGLTGAPSELWPLGVGLAAIGWRVEAPRWPGHGTRPEELFDVAAEDVLAAARRAVDEGPVPHAIVGLSMGALLALAVAPKGVGRLVLLAPALRLHGPSGWFERLAALPALGTARILMQKGKTAHLLPPEPLDGRPLPAFARTAAAAALAAPPADRFDGRYTRIPYRWGRELPAVRKRALEALDGHAMPVSLAHGLGDLTADPRATVELARRLGRRVAAVEMFGQSPHVLTLGPERAAVTAWVATQLGAAGDDAATDLPRGGSGRGTP